MPFTGLNYVWRVKYGQPFWTLSNKNLFILKVKLHGCRGEPNLPLRQQRRRRPNQNFGCGWWLEMKICSLSQLRTLRLGDYSLLPGYPGERHLYDSIRPKVLLALYGNSCPYNCLRLPGVLQEQSSWKLTKKATTPSAIGSLEFLANHILGITENQGQKPIHCGASRQIVQANQEDNQKRKQCSYCITNHHLRLSGKFLDYSKSAHLEMSLPVSIQNGARLRQLELERSRESQDSALKKRADSGKRTVLPSRICFDEQRRWQVSYEYFWNAVSSTFTEMAVRLVQNPLDVFTKSPSLGAMLVIQEPYI